MGRLGNFGSSHSICRLCTDHAKRTGDVLIITEDISAALPLDDWKRGNSPALHRASPIGQQLIQEGGAALLDELLTNRTRPVQSRRVPPLPIIERESSRYVFCDDEHVARALRMIRAEATDGVTAAEVAQAAHIGRRSLEMRFKRERGRTILEEIQEYRLREAERLLIHTTLAVKEIVQLCGFASEHRFFSLFRSSHAMTPLSFRAA